MQNNVLKGSCLCGEVTFSVELKSIEMSACHCLTCRKWTSGVFFSIQFKKLKFDKKTSLAKYNSSSWASRYFCSNCGTSLFFKTNNNKCKEVSVQCLENPEQFKFIYETCVDSQPNNYCFSNNTIKLTEEQVLKLY